MAFLISEGQERCLLIGEHRVIYYIDEGWGDPTPLLIQSVLQEALRGAAWTEGVELYVVAFLWRDGLAPMVDLWRFTENPVDKVSGPLADVRIMRKGKIATEVGVASGNTLLVLGLEETHRRRCRTLEEYLSRVLKLPEELVVSRLG